MQIATIAKHDPALSSRSTNLSALTRPGDLLWAIPAFRSNKGNKMTSTSKTLTAAAAALFASLFFVMTAPAAYADDYCITGGAQVAHGCGYPSMETCRAASAGIGGTCSLAAGSSTSNPNNANALAQPKRHTKRGVTNPNQPASQ